MTQKFIQFQIQVYFSIFNPKQEKCESKNKLKISWQLPMLINFLLQKNVIKNTQENNGNAFLSKMLILTSEEGLWSSIQNMMPGPFPILWGFPALNKESLEWLYPTATKIKFSIYKNIGLPTGNFCQSF